MAWYEVFDVTGAVDWEQDQVEEEEDKDEVGLVLIRGSYTALLSAAFVIFLEAPRWSDLLVGHNCKAADFTDPDLTLPS